MTTLNYRNSTHFVIVRPKSFSSELNPELLLELKGLALPVEAALSSERSDLSFQQVCSNPDAQECFRLVVLSSFTFTQFFIDGSSNAETLQAFSKMMPVSSHWQSYLNDALEAVLSSER
jgi:hypothetical protein